MLDLKRTIELTKGALFDPEPTWRDYLPEAGDWKRTALLLTGPLIVATAIISYLLGTLRGDAGMFGFRPTLASTVLSIVALALAAGVVAFVVSALAAAFRGKSSFPLALAATTLAFVPGYVGSALSGLPWIGFLLSIGLFIYSLVLLWRIIPIYLEVPVGSRAGHYVVSLLTCFVAMLVINVTVGGMLYGAASSLGLEAPQRAQNGALGGGIVGQAALLASAAEDTYAPPADGRLTEQQVQTFVRVMQRTSELQAEVDARLQDVVERAENDQQLSFRDLTQLMRGATEIAGLQTTEAEVVKTGGGNWAEHQWVRESLRTAWIQRDANPTVEHNYGLYERYRDQLADHIAR
jgi:hypothetical protein